jgi:hypothetical protein
MSNEDLLLIARGAAHYQERMQLYRAQLRDLS